MKCLSADVGDAEALVVFVAFTPKYVLKWDLLFEFGLASNVGYLSADFHIDVG